MNKYKLIKYKTLLTYLIIIIISTSLLCIPSTVAQAETGGLILYGTPAASNTIVLSWSGNSGAYDIAIERKMAGGNFAELATVGGSIKSWTDNTGLIHGASYTYRIKEKNSLEVSIYSNEATVINMFLNAPVNLTAAVGTDNHIEVNWIDNSNDESGFEIWRYTNGSASYQLYATVDMNTTHFTDENVIPGISYYYMVRAFIMPEGFYSSYAVSGTTGIGLLKPPSDLKFTLTSSTQAYLSWTDNCIGESGFVVERKQPGDEKWTSVYWLVPNTTSCVLSGLTPYVSYLYRVKVYTYNDNLSSYSNEVEVSMGLPMVPSDVKAVNVSSTQVKLAWKDNANNETGYRIERSAAGSRMMIIAEVGAGVAAYTDKGLCPDTIYTYRILAMNSLGTSPSTEVKVTTLSAVFFKDVTSNISWAKDAIENLAGRGVLQGKQPNLFRPYDKITRAEFTSIVVRAFGMDTSVPIGSMTDVWVGSWYYKNVMIAENLGIISCDNSGRFYPDRYITREEMAVIIAKTMTVIEKPLPGYDNIILENFVDRSLISQDALASMASVVGEGIIEGRSARAIAPKDTATRAEAAVILYRVIDR